MLVEFSIGNFRSFNSIQTLSFRATGLTSEADAENIISLEGNNNFLKILGIYGANASGKSNIIKGLSFFQEMVDSSLESEKVLERFMNPFKLKEQKSNNAGYFQIVLILDSKKYRYGFTLQDDYAIESEWLFGPAQKKETYYFKRTGTDIQINADFFKEAENLPQSNLRKDTLFLTFCSSYNGAISKTIKDYVAESIYLDSVTSTLKRSPTIKFFSGRDRDTTDVMVSDGKKEIVLLWLKEAGLTFSDIALQKFEVLKNFTTNRVKLEKPVYDLDGNISGAVQMDLDSDESEGTQKFYSYIGDLYERFKNGGIFVSDEIDSNFHPSLLRRLITLFQSTSVNQTNAQLLFTSHDTSLMSPDYMRRDQFYFTEKTIYDETKLYSLADLRGIRNNADFARQYLSGFYGALPQLGNLQNIDSDVVSPEGDLDHNRKPTRK